MKPTRQGHWWFRDRVAYVYLYDEDFQKGNNDFWFTLCGIENKKRVKETEDSDWGPEILPQCEHQGDTICMATMLYCKTVRSRNSCPKEITRPNPDESANGGNDAVG